MTDKPDIVDRLRDKFGPGSKLTPTGNSAHPLLEEAADAVEALRKQVEDAETYVRRLLVSFVKEHCDPVPHWKPLDGDLIGMLTQLDNAMTVLEVRNRIERTPAMTFETDEDALDVLFGYGHRETGNGVIKGDWRSFNKDCREAVIYLCDEWDFVFEDTGND